MSFPRYIVQHYEQGLKEGSWCALEYAHICEIAGDRLHVTTITPDEHIFFPHKNVIFHETNITSLDLGCPKDEICLFDMRAEVEVSPADAQRFKYFLFGGILGPWSLKTRKKLYSNYY
jgi:ribosome biogenesis SPOUT family RNA methylase Rps3